MTFKNGMFLALAAIVLAGCGPKPSGGKSFVTNKESVANLNSLMASHPEFQTASLMDIKMAAQGSDVKFSTDKDKPATEGAKPAQLDRNVAGKAQGLRPRLYSIRASQVKTASFRG